MRIVHIRWPVIKTIATFREDPGEERRLSTFAFAHVKLSVGILLLDGRYSDWIHGFPDGEGNATLGGTNQKHSRETDPEYGSKKGDTHGIKIDWLVSNIKMAGFQRFAAYIEPD